MSINIKDNGKDIVEKPTQVLNHEIGHVVDLICGDSSTCVRSMEGDKVYGWGRGYSIEKQMDVSRFKPKELTKIETLHRFLIQTESSMANRPTTPA